MAQSYSVTLTETVQYEKTYTRDQLWDMGLVFEDGEPTWEPGEDAGLVSDLLTNYRHIAVPARAVAFKPERKEV